MRVFSTLAATAILTCGAATIAHAEESAINNGTFLLKACGNWSENIEHGRDVTSASLTDGYCVGLLDGLSFMSIALDEAMKLDTHDQESTLKAIRVCWPDGIVTNGQKILIVTKFLGEHPELLNQNKFGLIIGAFRAAYPCTS